MQKCMRIYVIKLPLSRDLLEFLYIMIYTDVKEEVTIMQKSVSRDQALKNAFASARMEGYTVTPEIEYNCRRLLSGKISPSELVAELSKKNSDYKHTR